MDDRFVGAAAKNHKIRPKRAHPRGITKLTYLIHVEQNDTVSENTRRQDCCNGPFILCDFFLIATAICILLVVDYIGVSDVFAVHSVNTSIESCTTHLLRQEESQSQSEKNAV